MTMLPNYIDLPQERQDRARMVLTREIGLPLDETSADAAVEQIWNALVGHPLAGEE